MWWKRGRWGRADFVQFPALGWDAVDARFVREHAPQGVGERPVFLVQDYQVVDLPLPIRRLAQPVLQPDLGEAGRSLVRSEGMQLVLQLMQRLQPVGRYGARRAWRRGGGEQQYCGGPAEHGCSHGLATTQEDCQPGSS